MNWQQHIAQYDLLYDAPPTCWQDGLTAGNGSLGTVFYATDVLHWLVNKTDVIDGRTQTVREVIPADTAARMVRDGAHAEDFRDRERGPQPAFGLGPKTACQLTMAPGYGHLPSQQTALPDIRCRLGLYDATLLLRLRKHLLDARVESRVLATADVAVVRVRNMPLARRRTHLWFTRPRDAELPSPTVRETDGDVLIEQELPGAGRYVAACRIVPRPGGGLPAAAALLRPQYRPPETAPPAIRTFAEAALLTATGDFDVLTTVVTTRDAADPAAAARAALDRAVAEEDALHQAHEAWWADFWGRCWVDLGNRAEEQLYYLSLYALGCAYRKAPLSGLLGLVYGPGAEPVQSTPWHGDIHHDLNVQCPFFPVHMTDHAELFDAYLESFAAWLPEGRRLAREIFGVDGAHFDMCLNAVGKSMQQGVGMYRYALMGSYVGLMHALAWRYWHDDDRRRRWVAPFLEEIIRFYLAIARRDETGVHFWPAHAAELNVMDCADPVQTVSMLRVCLEVYLETPPETVDAGVRAEAARLLAELPAYPRGIDWAGREVVLDGVGIPADHHVGQAGCLHPVYPCGEVDALSAPETVALYSRTLDSVVDKTAQRDHGSHLGFHYGCVWQCFFRAMTALRLGRAGDVHDTYWSMFLACFAKPNGLVCHDATLIVDPTVSEAAVEAIPAIDFADVDERMPAVEAWHGHGGGSTPNPAAKRYAIGVIEGSADYLTMVTEMLLQSQRGIIRVFPGWWPDRDGAFAGLVAEGGIRVSARRRRGTVECVRLTGPPGDVRVLSPWTGAVETWTIPATGELVYPPDAAAPEPPPPEPAAIRTLYEDDHVTLILGKRRPDRTT